MTEIIYDGSKDPLCKNRMIITKKDGVIGIKFDTHNICESRTIITSGKIIAYKYYIVYDDSCRKSFKHLTHKRFRLISNVLAESSAAKTIGYDENVYVWTRNIDKVCCDTYNEHKQYYVENKRYYIDRESYKKDTLTLLMKSIDKYDPTKVDYGTVLYDFDIPEKIWPTYDVIIGTIKPNIFKGIVTGLTDIALVCP